MLAEYIFGFFLGLNTFEDEYHSRTTVFPETNTNMFDLKPFFRMSAIGTDRQYEYRENIPKGLTVDFGRSICQLFAEYVLSVIDFVLVSERVRVSQMISPVLRFLAQLKKYVVSHYLKTTLIFSRRGGQ